MSAVQPGFRVPRGHTIKTTLLHFPLCFWDSWCSLSASQQLYETRITNLTLYLKDLLKVTKREKEW